LEQELILHPFRSQSFYKSVLNCLIYRLTQLEKFQFWWRGEHQRSWSTPSSITGYYLQYLPLKCSAEHAVLPHMLTQTIHKWLDLLLLSKAGKMLGGWKLAMGQQTELLYRRTACSVITSFHKNRVGSFFLSCLYFSI